MMFTKENTSNGNMATVDVLFPMDPIWVFLQPDAGQGVGRAGVHVRRCSPQWKLPYAPHDLGEYPVAFSRERRERDWSTTSEPMPVEESGNMIILADAIAHADGNTKFSRPVVAGRSPSGSTTWRSTAPTPKSSCAPTTSTAGWRTTATWP